MRTRARRRDERGAIAVMTAVMATVLFGLGAIAIDISMLAMERQKLHDAVDSAAHAGAFAMPGDGLTAINAARSMALSNDADLSWDFSGQNPKIRLWCVVAATTSTPPAVKADQIPSTCNPGTGPFTTSKYPDLRCNTAICKIPCAPSPSTRCNTVEVVAEKKVPYGFANIWGISNGSTGSVASAACKGSCGSESPNPLDVVVMADRTASMETADRQLMKSAILESLKTMNPEMHYVAFGTIHKSRTSDFTPKERTYGPQTDDYATTGAADSDTKYNYNGHWDGTGKTKPTSATSTCLSEASSELPDSAATPPILKYGSTFTWGTPAKTWGPYPAPDRINPMTVTEDQLKSGTWIPVGFKNDYQLPKALPENPSVLNNNSDLVDSVSCLPQSTRQEYGTNLASAMKEAVRYAFANNPALTRPGNIRKVVIFETDGQPSEPRTFGNTDLASGDVGSTNGVTGCNNLTSVANAAKAAHGDKLLIITIGFGDAATAKCGGSGTAVRNVLAAAASPSPSGGASTANSCQGADIALENADGDFFFCSTSGTDLADIFKSAILSAQEGIKLVKLP